MVTSLFTRNFFTGYSLCATFNPQGTGTEKKFNWGWGFSDFNCLYNKLMAIKMALGAIHIF